MQTLYSAQISCDKMGNWKCEIFLNERKVDFLRTHKFGDIAILCQSYGLDVVCKNAKTIHNALEKILSIK